MLELYVFMFFFTFQQNIENDLTSCKLYVKQEILLKRNSFKKTHHIWFWIGW